LLGGLVILLISTFLMSQMGHHTSRLDLGWRMALLGLGLGPLQGLFNVAIQNSVPVNRIGVVTSASQFFRQIGSTVGVAVFGTFLTNSLNSKLTTWAASVGLPPLDLSSLRSQSIDAQAHSSVINLPEPIRFLIADAVIHVFALSIVIVTIALIAALMIPELPMRERSKIVPKDAIPADAHL
jgi:hypothetical protein